MFFGNKKTYPKSLKLSSMCLTGFKKNNPQTTALDSLSRVLYDTRTFEPHVPRCRADEPLERSQRLNHFPPPRPTSVNLPFWVKTAWPAAKRFSVSVMSLSLPSTRLTLMSADRFRVNRRHQCPSLPIRTECTGPNGPNFDKLTCTMNE